MPIRWLFLPFRLDGFGGMAFLVTMNPLFSPRISPLAGSLTSPLTIASHFPQLVSMARLSQN
eukprot:CAMPEP_0194480438 /NCGR_PEP_ID=MMETSP0253-20130528/3234_1 /TAXON_ID=2966 /ORGANISM="Noctiluca scintillans" /LENGTH=61 /DNA_ID=CAMNT_0039319819 /DNA_START=38 /DNA_END=220 /DNA_ORIENTATION=-